MIRGRAGDSPVEGGGHTAHMDEVLPSLQKHAISYIAKRGHGVAWLGGVPF